MPAVRVVEYHDNYSFDVQQEQGSRTVDDQGTPLAEPELVDLQVVVFYDRDPVTGTVLERRYRFLPTTWDALRKMVNGGVEVASADALGLVVPAGVRT